MKMMNKRLFVFACVLSFLFLVVMAPHSALAAKAKAKVATQKAMMTPNAKFDPAKMSDMSDFDPNNPMPLTGDTIKIAVVASFSGASAYVGELFWICVSWAAHDINKRGGILVDGKKRMVQLFKADHMNKQDVTKKVCERMILQEKVHVLWGSSSSNHMKVINEVAAKYKVIALSAGNGTDDLNDATNFTRYSFMTFFTTDAIGRAFAYYYGKIRKKEKKFYILCQDYNFGHTYAESFKNGLKQYYPEAEIVGEDYHKLFLTDFAPYLTKIKASGAEVIFTGDWPPDSANLLKQARQAGITIPFADVFLDDGPTLANVGIEGSKGIVNLTPYGSSGKFFKTPGQIKFYKTWNNLWKTKWQAPFNGPGYEHGIGSLGAYTMGTYWLLSVIERAKSLDPEKIIKVWEGDVFEYGPIGKTLKMRACDHKAIQNLHIAEFVPPDQQKAFMNIPPHYWWKNSSGPGNFVEIPADMLLPLMDQNLDRCKGKNGWGE